MKWKKKLLICNLLAGLTALMFNGCKAKPSVKLLISETLDFPSASGIEFYRDTLYVFGDNAPHLLLLSPDYRQLGTYKYWNSNEAIINKKDKPDIESAMIVNNGDKTMLLGIGSMSSVNRWHTVLLPIGDTTITVSQLFKTGSTFKGIEETNIEGSTAFGNSMLLCNRSNLSTQKNHLLLLHGADSILIKEIKLPGKKSVAGMSGLFYVEEKDLLLFTASEEATASATEDGAIGESYIGWVANFSKAFDKTEIETDGFLKLTAFDKKFAGQKIESLCVESFKEDRYLLHLAADNDNGKSVLFKVDLKL